MPLPNESDTKITPGGPIIEPVADKATTDGKSSDSDLEDHPSDTRITREEKQRQRSSRFAEMQRDLVESKRAIEDWKKKEEDYNKRFDSERAEREKVYRELSELKGRLSADSDNNKQSSYTEKHEKIEQEIFRLYQADNYTEARRKEAELRKLEYANFYEEQVKNNRQSMPDPTIPILSAEFPELESVPGFIKVADGFLERIAKTKGDNLATRREACGLALSAFGIKRESNGNNDSNKAAYTGASGGTSGKSAGSDYSLSKEEIAAAESMGISQEAFRKFRAARAAKRG